MGKRNSKVIIIIFAIIIIMQGLYFLVRFVNSTTPIVRFEEESISLPIESKVEKISTIDSLLIRSAEMEILLGEQEGYLNFGGWVQNLNSENLPLVVSVHRFGLRYLSPDYNVHETFYNVDKLKLDDTLELVWRENKYEYKLVDIYKGRNNKPIRDNQLVIYTCEYWDSPERVFTVWERIM